VGGKIWWYDIYDLRKFGIDDINTFIDIGANTGSVSMMAKILFSRTRIIAIEPSKETFAKMRERLRCWGKHCFECYNIALGNGENLYLNRMRPSGRQRQNGAFQFYTDKERKDKNIETDEDGIKSKTLRQIFDDYSIDESQPYVMKIDCEGGERFILQDKKESLNIIRNSLQTAMEIHFKTGGSKKEWGDCLSQVSDSHNAFMGWFDSPRKHPDGTRNYKRKYILSPLDFKSFTHRGNATIELVNKEWKHKIQ